MYRILIVDDKKLIRQGLIKMINWDALDAELAGEAEDGSRALQIIRKEKPDIVITDIRMPECDGITLLKSIALEEPDIQTIVISGYDEFEYVRQALKSGSLDYILKPVNRNELNGSIKKACEIIDKNRKISIKSLGENQESGYLYKLIHGLEVDEAAAMLMPEADTIGTLYCTVVFRHFGSTAELKKTYNDIKAVRGFKRVLTTLDDKELAVVFSDKRDYGEETFENKVFSSINDCVIQKNQSERVIAAGIGKSVRNAKKIPDSYQSACEAIYYSLLDESRNSIRYGDVSGMGFYNVPVEELETELAVNVTSGNIKAVNSILNKLYEKHFRMKDISLESLRLAISKLCHILIRLDFDISREIRDFLDKIGNPEYLWKFKSIRNIEQVLNNLYAFATEKYLKENGRKDSTAIKIKNYIEMYYSSDIGLESMAENFHMNASYLSSLFKHETGENVNEFITRVRIENSKRLLLAEGIRISQVARMVGYADDTYFYKVFKKVTGKTPKEYQDENKKK